MANQDAYLKAMLSLLGRQAFSPSQIAEIVGIGKEKQIDAYNACDGSRSQTEIAKSLSLDSGNFSKTVGRWIEAGIAFRIAEGSDAKLQHLYPIPARFKKAAKEAKDG